MNLVRTSFLNAVAVAVKIISLLGINKVIAVYVGPSGYAVIGQLQNAIQMILAVSGRAINTGVTKYVAEFKDSIEQQKDLLGTAFTINLFFSILTSLCLFILSDSFSYYFFKSLEYANIFRWLSITLVMFVLNSFVLAIINGKKENLLFVKVNILGSLISLVFTVALTLKYGLYGALIALVSNQSISFFLTLFMARNQKWLRVSNFRKFKIGYAKKLGDFAFLALVSALVIPLSHILVRNHLSLSFGWVSTGYWDAIWKISTIYLMFVTMTLKVYYLPRISEIDNREEMKIEILDGFKFLIPILIVISSLIYVFRDIVIGLVFTQEFFEMRELFKWQLIGDTLKIASWLLGFVLLGKAMIKQALISEVLFAFSFLVLVILMTNLYGLEGATIAHAINYSLYLCYMIVVLKKTEVI